MGVMMENYNVTSKNGYFDGDIEKGEVNVKLGGCLVFGSNNNNNNNNRMRELQCEDSDYCGLGNGNVSNKHEERAISSVNSSSDDDSESVRLVVVDKKVVEERNNGDVESKVVKEKPKAMSAKKPPKPPRPPRGLSLDSADQKLIRELHELARLKRARADRMKALRKAKEVKAASSKNQLFATLLTVLFCLVLLLQGISSRTSTATSIQGSPFSSEVAEQHNIISLQHYPVSSAANLNGLGSQSPRLVEQVSGIDTTEQVSRAVD